MPVNTLRFDQLTRAISFLLSRRALAGVLGLHALGVPALVDARKKKRKKKKKAKFNEFGCVNVGGFCKNDGQCCSGICSGKKDKKKCQAHDERTCQALAVTCEQEIECFTETGNNGECYTTTGNAGFCADSGGCFPCSKDADCQPFCGPRAACVQCAECVAQVDAPTACLGATGSCQLPL